MAKGKPNRLEHPDRCPECNCEIVYFGRFANHNGDTWDGEYYCDDCEWCINAVTGKKVDYEI
jgi:hypothetical protein